MHNLEYLKTLFNKHSDKINNNDFFPIYEELSKSIFEFISPDCIPTVTNIFWESGIHPEDYMNELPD